MNTLTKTTIVFFLILFTHLAYGNNTKMYNGYIITIDNDSIKGTIQMLSPTLNEVKVILIDIENRKKHFKAKEVKEYGFQVKMWRHENRSHYYKWVTYVKKEVEQSAIAFGPKQLLLEREVTGTINMYHHFVARPSNVEEPFWHIIYLEKYNSGLVKIDSHNYKEVLERLTIEYSSLLSVAESNRLNIKNLPKILERYNKWMIENEEETVIDYSEKK